MLVEASIITGYVVAWAARKVRRVAGRLDGEADAVIDAGLDRLHDVVEARLGGHPALADLDAEMATDGQASDLTRQQIELALTAALRKDAAFAHRVSEVVEQLQRADPSAGVARTFGDSYTWTSGNGISFGQVGGDVHITRGEQHP